MEYDERICMLVLSRVFNFQCAAGRKLIEFCGGPQEVFKAGPDGISGLIPNRESLVNGIFDPSLSRWAEEEAVWADSHGVRLICMNATGYPRRLMECDDAPLLLYSMGEADLNAGRMLAVVGTRKATYYGKTVCQSIIGDLARNPKPPTIVSGLAFGIDAEAHRSALNSGIPTVAVLPTGLDSIYPPAHRDLAKLIIGSGGALVTDFPRNADISRNQFIRRNRIIAGLSDATLLVESFAKGGGLITTSLANSYDREVFAVPGRTVDASFDGCNKLIERNLAHLVTGAGSIERSMGWGRPSSKKKIIPELDFGDDPVRVSVISLLAERSPVRFNSILESAVKPDGTGFSVRELSAILLDLELEGRVGVTGGEVYELIC